ncbi:50S ribosomal protein L17 [Deltaproteobacteria bacterium TL4]
MRHLKAGRRLGVTTSHRRAMMRNLVTSLIEHQEIYCTLMRAKELRTPLDKMITLAKRGDLHARRQALSYIKSKDVVAVLFDEMAERYKDRNGGYSRIIKIGKRRLGDGAEMAIIQLVDSPKDVLSAIKKPKTRKRVDTLEKASVLKEVSQEMTQEIKPDVPSHEVSASGVETVENQVVSAEAELSSKES